ncbi:MAG: HD-GYP domain-containing protein [Firmicutes bacterium]|nr:HD-GYP domain-containing protein [Bacillota bacterium]
MYELVETYQKHQENTDLACKLVENAFAFCQGLGFDHWKIIMFDPGKRYGTIQYSSENPRESLLHKQETIIFDQVDHKSFLKVVTDEKKIVIHRPTDNDQYISISEGVSTELYCPLFSFGKLRDVIGCLYLSKKDNTKNDINEQLADKNIVSHMDVIQRIFSLISREYIEEWGFFDLVHVLSEIIKAREPFMCNHAYNVALLSNLVGLKLGLSDEQLHRLYIAALLHDIGKLYISDTILNKSGPLTETERKELDRHPVYSCRIIKDLTSRYNILQGIEKIVLHHHERYDGTGHPCGAKGEDIPLKSRILSIADAVDAMLSKRSYKEPRSIKNVISELASLVGKQFDPQLASIMIDILIKEQGNQKTILKGPINVGTFELLTTKRACQLQGTLIKAKGGGYRFKVDSNECLCAKCNFPLQDLKKAAFHMEDNGKIYEYDATVKYKDKNNIYISKLVPLLSQPYFSFLWELKGTAIQKDLSIMEVTTYKIGGGQLGFCFQRDQLKDMDCLGNITSIRVRFEDNSEITVTGKVTRTVKIGNKLYCEYKYLNIPERTRDKIFGQIFKKHLEMRQGFFGIR